MRGAQGSMWELHCWNLITQPSQMTSRKASPGEGEQAWDENSPRTGSQKEELRRETRGTL